MALTQVSSKGIKNATLINEDVNASADIAGSKLADNSISLTKLVHGDSNNNGKFLRANNGADPSFEAIDLSSKFSKAGGDTITGDFTIASGTTNKNINIDVSDRIRFDDNLQATFGNSDDLKIYHTSNDNYLDLNSGTLKIRLASGADFIELQQDRDVWIKGEPKPWDNNTYSLGRSDYKWSAVHATTYYGDGSNLTGVTSTTLNGNTDHNVMTGTGTANTLQGESTFTHNPSTLDTSIIHNSNSPADLIIQNNSSGTAANARLTLTSGSNANSGPIFEMNVGSDSWAFLTPKNAGNLDLNDNGSLAFRFAGDGDFHIVDGDLVISSSGHGIDFSATGDASGASDELLNDYEEGAWTPTITFGGNSSGQSYSNNGQIGRYIKVGRLVHIQCYIAFSNKGSSTGTAKITGLPYTSRDQSGMYAAAKVAYMNSMSSASGPGGISDFLVYLEINDTVLNIDRQEMGNSGTGVNDATNSNFNNDTDMMITMTYVSN